MKKLLLILFIYLLATMDSDASWFCKQGASYATGNKTLLACGVASSADLQTARDNALSAARKEFQAICDMSNHCKDFDSSVKPMRTECTLSNGRYTCFRALEFKILSTKKKDVYVDIKQTRQAVYAKQNQLAELKEKLADLEYRETLVTNNRKLTRQINKARLDLYGTEAELIPLENRVSDKAVAAKDYNYGTVSEFYNYSFRLNLGYSGNQFQGQAENNYSLGTELEYRPVKLFGLGVALDFGTNLSAAQDNGPGTLKSTSYGLFVPIYFLDQIYLKLGVGQTYNKRQDTQNTYSRIGTIKSTRKIDLKETVQYREVSLGYDSLADKNEGIGTYIEVGIRQTGSNAAPRAAVGINFGF